MEICQSCDCDTSLMEKEWICQRAPNGFPCFCCSLSASSCLYMWIHTAANTDVKAVRLRRPVFIFITAVLHRYRANVLYIQMRWVTPVWALVLTFILWFKFFFLPLNFSGYFFWLLFWFASLRCFRKKKREEKKTKKSSDFKSSYCWY